MSSKDGTWRFAAFVDKTAAIAVWIPIGNGPFSIQGIKKVSGPPSDLHIHPIKRNHFVFIQEYALPHVQ
jgi:hypothetical protein